MDYGKSIFEKKKQIAAAKKNQKQIQVKEIKFRPGTEEGDYQVKLRNLVRFLSDGDRAKVSLRFRGREMAHQELGMELLKRVEADLLEYGSVEQHPKMEGRQLIMVIAPKKKNRFIAGLKKASIEIDRKVLADLAVNEKAAFAAIVEKAKATLA
eukprot:gene8658-13390_t